MNIRDFLRKALTTAAALAALIIIQSLGMETAENAQAWGPLPVIVSSDSGSGGCVSGNDSDCVLLIHSNTTDGSTTFVDSSQGGADHTADITAGGNVHHETDQAKFGTTSIETAAVGSGYLSIADSVDWDFGTGDFSIEFWVMWKGSIGNTGLLGRYAGEANTWGLQYSAGNLYWYYGNGVEWHRAWTPAAADTWYHICIARESNVLKFFAEGTQLGADEADNTNYNTATALEIGRHAPAGNIITGYFDEIAIFRGTANGRTANFTPPTKAYCD